MVEISPRRLDHVLLRQVLAAALAAGKEVIVRGGTAFINATPEVQPLVSDWERFMETHRLGAFDISGGDLVFTPGAVGHGTRDFETNPYSSAVELVLLLAPALFARPFRSALTFGGVTHASHSWATDFVRETLFRFLEHMGFYASLSLKRFGFYGTGKGALEAKIFPAGKRRADRILPAGPPRPAGARVCIAGYPSALARAQKGILAEELGLSADDVGIIEIMNAAGSGNTMHVVLDWGGAPVLVPNTVDAYSLDGSHAADEQALCGAARAFARYVSEIVREGVLPAAVVRELVPYALMTGSVLPDSNDPEAVGESMAVIGAILR